MYCWHIATESAFGCVDWWVMSDRKPTEAQARNLMKAKYDKSLHQRIERDRIVKMFSYREGK